MKSAIQWQEELAGETSVESIRSIQSDALLHAMRMVSGKRCGRCLDVLSAELNALQPPEGKKE